MVTRCIRVAGILLLMAVLVCVGKTVMKADTKTPKSGLQPVSEVTQGVLQAVDKQGNPLGQCPLKHTSVTANVSGFVARVDVTQDFVNTSDEKIEAIYVFPLPHDAAVDQMEMHIGERVIRGEIKRKEEARQIYEAAKESGHVASLLDQERPNIFTQSVANIVPGEKIRIKISYVNLLKYENGQYEFAFPMVVGPRYIPGNSTGKQGQGWSSDTDKVPDASRITPPVKPEGTRAGRDISIEAEINGISPIGSVQSVLHEVDVKHIDQTRIHVSLSDQATIPNKDFILRYQVAGDAVRTGILTATRGDNDGYLSLVLVPPKSPTQDQITPKEMIFVIDSSGSQMGWPIEKAKETMKLCVEQMNPHDTFQMLAFSNEVIPLFDKPEANNSANRALAEEFLTSRLGSGGTEMMKAVVAALTPPPDPERLRIVCFMTDGYVGNDMEILDAVKQNVGGARVFPFGIGDSVNRFLLDGMAEAGRGAVEYVTLQEKGAGAAQKFYDRISKPILTDISIDWGNLPVVDNLPQMISDLFSQQPVIIKARYLHAASGAITIHGKLGGKAWQETLKVDLPENDTDNPAIPTLWAREKIAILTAQDYAGIQNGQPDEANKEEITKVALEYGLMSQFTSFVAVEETTVTEGGIPKTVAVPVEMPEGVSYQGVFGDRFQSKAVGVGASVQLYGQFNQMAASTMAFSSAPAPSSAPALSASAGYSVPTNTFPARAAKRARTSSSVSYKLDYSDNFDSGAPSSNAKRPLSAAELRTWNIYSRLDPTLQGISAKLDKRGNYTRPGKVVVRSGKTLISIRLAAQLTSSDLAKLKALGFQRVAATKSVAMVIGNIPVTKLDSLAQLAFVARIAPVL